MSSFLDNVRIAATAGLVAAAPTALAVSAAPQSGQAAVLFDPGLSRAETLARLSGAGADLVRFGRAPGLVIVDLPDTGAPALRRAGAWLVFDPLVLGGCAPASQTPPI